MTGLVLGMVATAVKPPATAAAKPVSSVSDASPPGLPQMHVDIHKTGRHHVPARVERFIRSARKVRADLANHAVFNADVQHPVEIVFRRQNAAALDQYGSHEVLNDLCISAGRQYSTGSEQRRSRWRGISACATPHAAHDWPYTRVRKWPSPDPAPGRRAK